MIAFIEGRVLRLSDRFMVIETGGLGYKVSMTDQTLLQAKVGNRISLWTYHVIREDTSALFGFTTEKELSLFEHLLTVSGIGPKTALGVLNVATPESLTRAISSGETSHLIKVSGISKKIAEKIVLELRDKFKKQEETAGVLRDEVDVWEALKSLGYSHKDIKEALDEMPQNISDTSDKIKRALKFLGSNRK